jgi:hypothetical protein
MRTEWEIEVWKQNGLFQPHPALTLYLHTDDQSKEQRREKKRKVVDER